MRLLKSLVSFIVGTIAGAIGSKLFGPFGAILGLSPEEWRRGGWCRRSGFSNSR